jgi:hypothetical protein
LDVEWMQEVLREEEQALGEHALRATWLPCVVCWI